MTRHTAGGGLAYTIRRIAPEDKVALREGLRELSPEAVLQRFHEPRLRLSSAELRYLTEVDFVDHYAVVAVDEAHAHGRLLAVGRWIRDPERPDTAEIAIVVADDARRRGVGLAVGRALADAASERGITRFDATIRSDNPGARRLLAAVSAHLEAAGS